ncbi:MAG: energy-coupling factor ABC transporter permease [Desulfobacterota bacterium]|nr:energy-coupling factor ABC transporter permease [Thermodesulfobacteriota bacterium]
MSHIHLPDGILPVWLWASGFILAILMGFILVRRRNKEVLGRRLPLLGMMAATMVLGASVEIVPIAYHVNLMVVSGILLGPSLIFLATFVVNVILALFGHGGVTVIGLNTLILSIEGIGGYLFFRLLWKMWRRLTPAAFLATFLALCLSTFSMVGVVRLGLSHYEELLHRGEAHGLFEFKLLKGHDDLHGRGEKGEAVHFERFIALLLPLSLIGWCLEGVLTTLILRYLHRLRPDLLKLE